MQAYVYGERRKLPDGFAAFTDRAASAIVSIDMHDGHLADTPDCPCPAPRGREIVAPIDAFHDEARRLGVPIIHVRTVLRRGGVDDVRGGRAAWRLVFPLHVGDIPNADAHAIEGSRWTRFVTRVGTVILNGGFTDCCVLNAAFDASNHDYRVVVLRDLVRGTNAEMEEAALKMISLHLGLVMDTADLLAEWRSPAPEISAPISK